MNFKILMNINPIKHTKRQMIMYNNALIGMNWVEVKSFLLIVIVVEGLVAIVVLGVVVVVVVVVVGILAKIFHIFISDPNDPLANKPLGNAFKHIIG